MKKLALVLTLSGIAGLGLAGVSPAEARTVGGTESVPTQCTVTLPASGVVVDAAVVLPNCVDLDYLCVIAVTIVGPARPAHVQPRGENPGPCATFPAECVIPVVNNPKGPSRPAHVATRVTPALVDPYEPGDTFDIPSTCDDELVSTGANTTPALLLGLSMVGAGAAILAVSRRRLALVGR